MSHSLHTFCFTVSLIILLTSFGGCKNSAQNKSSSESSETAKKYDKVLLARKDKIKNQLDFELKQIPAGSFDMGAKSLKGLEDLFDGFNELNCLGETPQHRVEITKSFYMSATEVTQKQWKLVMKSKPWKGKSHTKAGDDFPASCVSWDDANEFCRRVSLVTGVTCRLPTEAEWEYACRAGSKTMFHFGDSVESLDQYGWYLKNCHGNGETYPHRVGQKKPNSFGLYDMLGNVYEWCQDSYSDEYYQMSPTQDPVNLGDGIGKVFRGGSWDNKAYRLRSSYRFFFLKSTKNALIGFRVVFEEMPQQ